MENSTEQLEPKKKKGIKMPEEVYRKIDGPALKLLTQLRDKANKKNYGKVVQDSEIIAVGLSLIEDNHVKTLQEKSLSNKDRLNLNHEEYCKKHGKISLDEYLGILMQSENKIINS